MRRVLLVVVLMVSLLGIAATPAYAPGWCPDAMTQATNVLISSTVNGNGNWVSAELNRTGTGYGQLRARNPGPTGAWERFRFVCTQGPDVYAIQSLANNHYVSAEISWTGNSYGLLRARASSIGPWEQFRITETDGPFYTWRILSLANNRYVSAEVGWTGSSHGSLRSWATSYGPWEQFVFARFY